MGSSMRFGRRLGGHLPISYYAVAAFSAGFALFFRAAAVMPPLAFLGRSLFRGYLGWFDCRRSHSRAFFAAAFTALFFFAQRFCWASAMRWRASALTTRLVQRQKLPGQSSRFSPQEVWRRSSLG